MRKKKNIKKATARSNTLKKKPVKKAKRILVPRTRNAGTWTEAQYFQKIRSALRNGFRYWKPIMRALSSASRPYTGTNKRQRVEYQCAQCKKWFPRTQIQVDHIIPCGSLNNYEDIVPFIKNLTIEDAGAYQILCKKDHKIKTDEEKKQRQLNKCNATT